MAKVVEGKWDVFGAAKKKTKKKTKTKTVM